MTKAFNLMSDTTKDIQDYFEQKGYSFFNSVLARPMVYDFCYLDDNTILVIHSQRYDYNERQYNLMLLQPNRFKVEPFDNYTTLAKVKNRYEAVKNGADFNVHWNYFTR